MAQVSSRGCSRAFLICVLYHVWQHVKQLKKKKQNVVFPFPNSLIISWLNSAHSDCSNGSLNKLYGGNEYVEGDPTTYWSEPCHFLTWWKNNVERKDKFTKIVQRSLSYAPGNSNSANSSSSRDLNALRYSRQMVALSINIKSHFDRVIKQPTKKMNMKKNNNMMNSFSSNSSSSHSTSNSNLSHSNYMPSTSSSFNYHDYPPMSYPPHLGDANLQQHYYLSKNYKSNSSHFSSVSSSPNSLKNHEDSEKNENDDEKIKNKNSVYYQQYEELLNSKNKKDKDGEEAEDDREKERERELIENDYNLYSSLSSVLSDDKNTGRNEEKYNNNIKKEEYSSSSTSSSSNSVSPPSLFSSSSSSSVVVQLSLPVSMPTHLVQREEEEKEERARKRLEREQRRRDNPSHIEEDDEEDITYIEVDFQYLPIVVNLLRDASYQSHSSEDEEFSIGKNYTLLTSIKKDMLKYTKKERELRERGGNDRNFLEASSNYFNEIYSRPASIGQSKVGREFSAYDLSRIINFVFSDLHQPSPSPSYNAIDYSPAYDQNSPHASYQALYSSSSNNSSNNSSNSDISSYAYSLSSPLKKTKYSHSIHSPLGPSNYSLSISSPLHHLSAPSTPSSSSSLSSLSSSLSATSISSNSLSLKHSSSTSSLLAQIKLESPNSYASPASSSNTSSYEYPTHDLTTSSTSNSSHPFSTPHLSYSYSDNSIEKKKNSPAYFTNSPYHKKKSTKNSKKFNQQFLSTSNPSLSCPPSLSTSISCPNSHSSHPSGNSTHYKENYLDFSTSFYPPPPHLHPNIDPSYPMIYSNPGHDSNPNSSNHTNPTFPSLHVCPNLFDNDETNGDSFTPFIGKYHMNDPSISSSHSYFPSISSSVGSSGSENTSLRSSSMDAVEKLLDDDVVCPSLLQHSSNSNSSTSTSLNIGGVDIDETILPIGDEMIFHNKQINLCGPEITQYLDSNDWNSYNNNNINNNNNNNNNNSLSFSSQPQSQTQVQSHPNNHPHVQSHPSLSHPLNIPPSPTLTPTSSNLYPSSCFDPNEGQDTSIEDIISIFQAAENNLDNNYLSSSFSSLLLSPPSSIPNDFDLVIESNIFDK